MPEIKFNGQTYTVLHTSATANKVLGVKQRSEKKRTGKKSEENLYYLPPCLQLMPRYTFCCFECAYQKTHTALTCIPKKNWRGQGYEWGGGGSGKVKRRKGDEAGRLSFPRFFFCSVFTFGGKAGEDPLQVLHMTADTSWRPRDTHPRGSPPPHTHTQVKGVGVRV